MSYRLICPQCANASISGFPIPTKWTCPSCQTSGEICRFDPKWMKSENDFRAKTSSNILARLLASPSTRVDGKPFNADVDLPELAEVAVNAADALIVALSRPPNEALLVGNRVVKFPEVVKEVVKEP